MSSNKKPFSTPEAAATASPPMSLGTIVLDGVALRDALVEALLDPRVLERLAAAYAARGLGTDGSTPRFMNAKEYAKHARVGARTLDYLRLRMTEGVHFSRTGTRVRYHVKEADEFIARANAAQVAAPDDASDLKRLAQQEAAKRRLKPKQEKT